MVLLLRAAHRPGRLLPRPLGTEVLGLGPLLSHTLCMGTHVASGSLNRALRERLAPSPPAVRNASRPLLDRALQGSTRDGEVLALCPAPPPLTAGHRLLQQWPGVTCAWRSSRAPGETECHSAPPSRAWVRGRTRHVLGEATQPSALLYGVRAAATHLAVGLRLP